MFKNTYQSGFLSILYSIGSKPLQIWDKQSKHSLRNFIPLWQFAMGTSRDWPTEKLTHQFWRSWAQMSAQTSSLLLPTQRKPWVSSSSSWSLSSRMYFFRPSFKTALISEQLKKYFTFEVQILDDKNIRRRFRPSNYQVPVLDPHGFWSCDAWSQIECDQSEAVYLHHANETGRRMEPNSV